MLIAVSDGDLVCARWRGGREGASSDSCLLNQGREKDCTQPTAAVSSQWITSSVTAVSRRAEPPEEENRTTSPSQRCPTAQGRLKTTEFSPENSHPQSPQPQEACSLFCPPNQAPWCWGVPQGRAWHHPSPGTATHRSPRGSSNGNLGILHSPGKCYNYHFLNILTDF